MIKKIEKLKIEKLNHEKDRIKKEAQKQVLTYITAAFGLVAGLAWNEAIKALIEYLFPLGQNTLWAKFLYAIIITFVVVIVSIYLMRLFKEEKEEEN